MYSLSCFHAFFKTRGEGRFAPHPLLASAPSCPKFPSTITLYIRLLCFEASFVVFQFLFEQVRTPAPSFLTATAKNNSLRKVQNHCQPNCHSPGNICQCAVFQWVCYSLPQLQCQVLPCPVTPFGKTGQNCKFRNVKKYRHFIYQLQNISDLCEV